MSVIANDKEFLWVEKYRPRTIDACILPDRMRSYFSSMVEPGTELQNSLLVGSPGCGKTTVAKALCNELGLDVLVINCSESGNIDTLRTTIRGFASTMSFSSPYKVVILDEADGLNACFGEEQKVRVVENDKIVLRTMKELENTEFKTLTFDFETNDLIVTDATCFSVGEEELFKVTLEDGSEIICTENHPFFNSDGTETTIASGEIFDVAG